MSSRICTLLLFVFTLQVCAQESFKKDSIVIENQTNKLLQSGGIINDENIVKDSIIKNISNKKSDKINDFALFQTAKYYYVKGKLPIALSIANKAIEDDYKDDTQDAKFYNLKGILLTLEKKYDAAISSYLKAVKGYDKGGELIKEHVVYNNIANIYLALGDFEQSYYYISKCFKVVGNYPENKNYLTMLGILTICENNLDKLDDANNHLNELIPKVDSSRNMLAKVIAYYAQSEYLFKNGDYLKAIKPAEKSIALSEQFGLNQYVLTGKTLLLKVYNELGDYEKSLVNGQDALRYLKTSKNKTTKHSIYQGLSIAYANQNDFEKAYSYQKTADSIRSIDRKLKTRSKLDSLLVAFETSEAQNEVLRKEVELKTKDKKIKERNNLITLISLVLIIFLIITIAVFLYIRQKRSLENEKNEKKVIKAMQEGEVMERKRISSELHDGLASELTALKIAIEKEELEDPRIFNLLSNAHALTRRISHNLAPLKLEQIGFDGAVADFIKNNDFDDKISYYTNLEGHPKLDKLKQTVLFRCIQELIQNAMKHSKAQKINVQILQLDQMIQISVEDDGIGFEVQRNFKGIGLSALQERLSAIGSDISIDSSPGNGTSIFITVKTEE